MLVAAFRYTAGWGALTTLVGTLGAVLLTQRWVAAEQRAVDREHELTLRKLELRDAHLARLHDERLNCFRAFLRQVQDRQAVRDRFRRAESEQRLLLENKEVELSHELRKELLPRKVATYHEMSDEYRRSGEAMRKALLLVKTVVSTPVRAEIRALIEAMDAEQRVESEVARARQDGRYPTSTEWMKLGMANKAVKTQEEKLEDAISRELRLDE
jgi:hypothetical protein